MAITLLAPPAPPVQDTAQGRPATQQGQQQLVLTTDASLAWVIKSVVQWWRSKAAWPRSRDSRYVIMYQDKQYYTMLTKAFQFRLLVQEGCMARMARVRITLFIERSVGRQLRWSWGYVFLWWGYYETEFRQTWDKRHERVRYVARVIG